MGGLDGDARLRLLALPDELQEEVMTAFAPGQSVRDVSSKFVSFVKSKERKASQASREAGDWQCPNCNDLQFARNTHCRLCDEPKPSEVISGDSPANWGRKRRIEPDDMSLDVDAFVKQWGLDENVRFRLLALSDDLRADVMSSFDPGPATRQVSAKFVSFLRSKERKSGQGNPEPQSGDWHCPNCNDLQFARNVRCRSCDEPRPDNAAEVRSSNDELERFGDQWELSHEALEWLERLPDHLRREVMKNFAPSKSTKQVSSRFISYVQSILKKHDSELGPAPWKRRRIEEAHHDSASKRSRPSSLDDFVRRWELNEIASAKLYALPQELQIQAMETFSPRAGQKDMSSKFVAFIRSLAAKRG